MQKSRQKLRRKPQRLPTRIYIISPSQRVYFAAFAYCRCCACRTNYYVLSGELQSGLRAGLRKDLRDSHAGGGGLSRLADERTVPRTRDGDIHRSVCGGQHRCMLFGANFGPEITSKRTIVTDVSFALSSRAAYRRSASSSTISVIVCP